MDKLVADKSPTNNAHFIRGKFEKISRKQS